MADIVRIHDPADERVADFVALNDPDLRRRREQSGGAQGGFFVAEGDVVIRQLLRSAYRVRGLLLTPLRLAALAPELERVDAPVYVAPPAVVTPCPASTCTAARWPRPTAVRSRRWRTWPGGLTSWW